MFMVIDTQINQRTTGYRPLRSVSYCPVPVPALTLAPFSLVVVDDPNFPGPGSTISLLAWLPVTLAKSLDVATTRPAVSAAVILVFNATQFLILLIPI